MNHADANEYPKKDTSTSTYSFNGKRRIYSKFCIIYGVQFSMLFRCYFHRICCHFGTSTFYDITHPYVCPPPHFVFIHIIRSIRILFIQYSYQRTLRFVSFSFAVAFIGPMPGNLLLLCHIYTHTHAHTYIYIFHIAYIRIHMFIHIADDDSNQDNKNKYYTIFDCAAFWLN